MAIRIPTHPGDFIRHVYLDPLNLSAAEVAEALEINAGTFSRLLNGKAALSPELALKLSKVLGRTPESWMQMQTNHTLAVVKQTESGRTWKPSKRVSGGAFVTVRKHPMQKDAAA
jgi:addiction module HigA family antidote